MTPAYSRAAGMASTANPQQILVSQYLRHVDKCDHCQASPMHPCRVGQELLEKTGEWGRTLKGYKS